MWRALFIISNLCNSFCLPFLPCHFGAVSLLWCCSFGNADPATLSSSSRFFFLSFYHFHHVAVRTLHYYKLYRVLCVSLARLHKCDVHNIFPSLRWREVDVRSHGHTHTTSSTLVQLGAKIHGMFFFCFFNFARRLIYFIYRLRVDGRVRSV